MAKVEQKHLEGLTYRTTKIVKSEAGGKKKTAPVERPLTIEDLLSQSEQAETFTVVTKDGRKHVVPKAPAPGKSAKAGKEE